MSVTFQLYKRADVALQVRRKSRNCFVKEPSITWKETY
jgi:hypothetical protein